MSNRFGEKDKCLGCVNYTSACRCPSPEAIKTACQKIKARREGLGIDGRDVTPSEVRTDSAWIYHLATIALEASKESGFNACGVAQDPSEFAH